MIGSRTLVCLLALLSAAGPGRASAAAAGAVAAGFEGVRQQQVVGADGVPLAVVEEGNPALPSVVFIHGYRQSHLSWFAQFGSLLSKHCHLVAYDLRGHGDSGAPWQSEAYDRSSVWAIDLARVIQATGTRRPLIVAWSFGGLVAMDYLRDVGSEIAGLVLVGTTGQLLPDPPKPQSMPSPPMLAARAAAAQASADAVYGPQVDPQVRALLATASVRTGAFIDVATLGRAATLDNGDLLPKVRALPVTLVNGSEDPIVPRPWIAQLKELLPDARVVELPGSGHAPFVDASGQFNALLEELHCHE